MDFLLFDFFECSKNRRREVWHELGHWRTEEDLQKGKFVMKKKRCSWHLHRTLTLIFFWAEPAKFVTLIVYKPSFDRDTRGKWRLSAVDNTDPLLLILWELWKEIATTDEMRFLPTTESSRQEWQCMSNEFARAYLPQTRSRPWCRGLSLVCDLSSLFVDFLK